MRQGRNRLLLTAATKLRIVLPERSGLANRHVMRHGGPGPWDAQSDWDWIAILILRRPGHARFRFRDTYSSSATHGSKRARLQPSTSAIYLPDCSIPTAYLPNRPRRR